MISMQRSIRRQDGKFSWEFSQTIERNDIYLMLKKENKISNSDENGAEIQWYKLKLIIKKSNRKM